MNKDQSWWMLQAPVLRDQELLEEVDRFARQDNRSRASAIRHLILTALAAIRRKESDIGEPT